MSTTAPRPQQVTFACLLAGGASVIVLLSIISRLSAWGAIEVREAVSDAIDQAGIDVSVDTALEWARWALMGAAAASVAGLVLAVYAFRGDKGARIGLSVLAGLSGLAFAATGVAGILPAVASVICVVGLWSADARAWYAGRPLPEKVRPEKVPTERVSSERVSSAPPPGPTPPPAAPDEPASGDADPPVDVPPPPPYRGFAEPTPTAPSEPPHTRATGPTPTPVPYAHRPDGPYHAPAGPPPRPTQAIVASIVASAMSGLVLLVAGLFALVWLVAPSELESVVEDEGLADQPSLSDLGLTADELAERIGWSALGLAALAALGVAVGLLLLVRRSVTWVLGMVMASVTVVVSIALVPFGLVLVALPWTSSAVVVVVLLGRPQVRAWYRR